MSNTEKGPVTQPWLHSISFMQQTVLLTAVRGPDGLPKYAGVKYLLRWYRRCILWPNGSWWIASDGDLWPSHPILFRLGPEAEAARKAKMAEAAERFRQEELDPHTSDEGGNGQG